MIVQSIGFVGTGAITEAMVRGLLLEPACVSQIVISPRNAEVAARLEREFPAVRIAGDNQAVLDGSDVAVLAIRPQIAKDVIESLRFREGQTVISVVAATERASLLDWIGADVHLVQAIPLPFVAERQGVTAIFPPDRLVAELFDTLGRAVQCDNRREYDLLGAGSALMSTYFGILESAATWLADNGMQREKANAYLAQLFASLSARASASDTEDFAALSEEFATKGGLNDQVLADFDRDGGRAALHRALDRVFARIEGRSS